MQPDVQLTTAVLIYTPGQYTQFHRPFEVDLNGNHLTNILNATENGQLLSPAAVAGVASTIITPSSTPEGQMYIDNGMQADRFAFFIEITTKSVVGVSEREIIRGFTDSVGVSPITGAIDPNMVFHINSRTVIREADTIGAAGGRTVRSVANDFSVLAEDPSNPNATPLRPEDAVAYQQINTMRWGDNGINDTRTTLRGVAKQGFTEHCIPSHYLSDMCVGYNKATNPAYSAEFEDANVYDKALPFVRAQSIQQSMFYNQIGGHNPAASHTFTFAQIDAAWPRTPDFWAKVMPQPGMRLRSPMEDTEHWSGARPETVVAFSLTHIMPALMSKMMLTGLEIAITNMNFEHKPMITLINYVEMFKGTMNSASAQHLCTQIELDVIHGLLLQKAVVFSVYLKVDLLSNSQFSISLNEGETVPYNAPMFCDSYFSPLVGKSIENLSEISQQMENLVSEFDRRNNGGEWGMGHSGAPLASGGPSLIMPTHGSAPMSRNLPLGTTVTPGAGSSAPVAKLF